MKLVVPAAAWRDAFLDMARDYEQAGEYRYSPALRDFPTFLRELQRDPPPDGWVPAQHFWLEHDGALLARSTLRLRLTAALEREGGHIGYDVRPSVRRRGIGTEVLRLTLFEARARGIGRACVTCDADNLGSRKIIERNGGVLSGESESEDSGKSVLRYWIA